MTGNAGSVLLELTEVHFGREVHAMTNERPAEITRTCFVVMGFGKKTDFETGRTLDLDNLIGTSSSPLSRPRD